MVQHDRPTDRIGSAILLALVLLAAACSQDDGPADASDPVMLYTCVDDAVAQAMIEEFERANSGTDVELFRAPTAELNARVAGDVRSGGLRADVVWACDPITMQGLVDQDLVGGWTPDNAPEIPAEYRTADWVGAAVLYIVAVHRNDVPAPQTWSDLASADYSGGLAIPDPAFAASALGALGYFAGAEGYGLDFYRGLVDHGAVQVSTPDEVTTGVAQGIYDAGLTTANSAYVAQESGSPIGVTWPEPGAVAVYGPVALATDAAGSTSAQDFISFVISEPGQTTLADAGSYPTRTGVSGPTVPADAPVVQPDWPTIVTHKDDLLADYQQLFGS